MKGEKINQTRRTIMFLEYLKKNTDPDHKINLKDVREYFEGKNINLGSRNTVHTFLVNLADAMNLDENYFQLPDDDWRIVFDDYKAVYGEAGDTEEFEKDYLQVSNLYYNPEFSHEDISSMVEAINFSRTMEPERAEKLKKILEEKFASKHYKTSASNVCKIYETPKYDIQQLRDNLRTIQQAIDENVEIKYRFNGYTREGKLAPAGDYERFASPYYIVANDGKYYLLAANEKYMNTYILRVDLMSDVSKTESKRIPKRDVKNMPQQWDTEYTLKHLGMSYDKPQVMTLRVLSKKGPDGKSIEPEYNFLFAAVGDKYKYLGPDKNDKNYDLVEVKCSPYGMINFALQHAEKMEVLKPESVRKEIQNRIRQMAEMYGVMKEGKK